MPRRHTKQERKSSHKPKVTLSPVEQELEDLGKITEFIRDRLVIVLEAHNRTKLQYEAEKQRLQQRAWLAECQIAEFTAHHRQQQEQQQQQRQYYGQRFEPQPQPQHRHEPQDRSRRPYRYF